MGGWFVGLFALAVLAAYAIIAVTALIFIAGLIKLLVSSPYDIKHMRWYFRGYFNAWRYRRAHRKPRQ